MHLYHLTIILQLLLQNKLFAKLSKWSFCQTKIDYLVHIVSAHGVEMDRVKISVVLQWPRPMTIKQLQGFLGLTDYYCRFIKHYALLDAPLTQFLQRDCNTREF